MEIIDQVRGAANIVEIAGQYTTLRQRGRKFVGLCPFHAEKTPSFTVDAEKQLFHCFGCGVGGDVFSIVMEKENLSFPEALKHLAERYHVPLPQRRLSPQALKLEEQVQKANESALAFFRQCLLTTSEGKKALEYLKKRGIDEAIIREFKLGYAPNTWDSLLSYLRAKGMSEAFFEKAGLVLPGRKPGEFYDRFRGRVIFPIFGLTGKALGFGGRALFDQDPKYLNSPDTPVYTKGHVLYGLNFTKDHIRASGELILVEGYTDFLSLYQAGFKNVAASLGTALTANQVSLALRFAPKVVISYDGDAAGKLAASRAVPLLFEKEIEVSVLVLPDHLDPDSFLKKHGAEAYRDLMEKKRAPLIDFLIDHFSPKEFRKTPEEKVKIATAVLRATLINPNSLKGSEYLKLMCERLRIDETIIRDMLNVRFKEDTRKNGAELLPAEKRLLQIVFEVPELRPEIFAALPPDDLKDLKSEPILRIIRGSLDKDKELILHELQKEIGPVLSRALSQALVERGVPPTLEEALDCLDALQISCKENELRRVQTEIAREEKAGDRARLEALLTAKQNLVRQILALR
jgi:DNA primase